MDTVIVTVYCLTDDWLLARRHQESLQRKATDAEGMTAAIVAARFFGGNFETALDLLKGPSYFGVRLNRSRFNRRLHALDSVIVLSECERAVAPKGDSLKKLPDFTGRECFVSSGRYEPVGSEPVGSETLSAASTEQFRCLTTQLDVAPITKGGIVCF